MLGVGFARVEDLIQQVVLFWAETGALLLLADLLLHALNCLLERDLLIKVGLDLTLDY